MAAFLIVDMRLATSSPQLSTTCEVAARTVAKPTNDGTVKTSGVTGLWHAFSDRVSVCDGILQF